MSEHAGGLGQEACWWCRRTGCGGSADGSALTRSILGTLAVPAGTTQEREGQIPAMGRHRQKERQNDTSLRAYREPHSHSLRRLRGRVPHLSRKHRILIAWVWGHSIGKLPPGAGSEPRILYWTLMLDIPGRIAMSLPGVTSISLSLSPRTPMAHA